MHLSASAEIFALLPFISLYAHQVFDEIPLCDRSLAMFGERRKVTVYLEQRQGPISAVKKYPIIAPEYKAHKYDINLLHKSLFFLELKKKSNLVFYILLLLFGYLFCFGYQIEKNEIDIFVVNENHS